MKKKSFVEKKNYVSKKYCVSKKNYFVFKIINIYSLFHSNIKDHLKKYPSNPKNCIINKISPQNAIY